MQPDPRSVLVIDASPFSRALVLLPMLRALRQRYPQTFLAAATAGGVCELLESARLTDQTINFGVIKPAELGGGSFKRFFQLIKNTRREGFELALDVSPRLETQLPSRLMLQARTVTPVRLAGLVDTLLRRGGGPDVADNHLAECAEVLRKLKIEMEDSRLGVEPPAAEDAKFEERLARHRAPGGEPVVVLHGAGAPHGWSAAAFTELAGLLAGNFGARVVAADEPGDTAFTRAVGESLPKGAIQLTAPRAAELAAALARASMLVTDDPGLPRLAADLGTPALEIAASAVTPLAETHRAVRGSSRAAVAAADVFAAAGELLKTDRSRRLFKQW